MANGKATGSQFGDLHELVAVVLIEQINAWKEHRLVEERRDEGVVTYVKVFPPALLAQAIKFLKDNGIDAPALGAPKTDTLKHSMPDFEDDNVIPIRK